MEQTQRKMGQAREDLNGLLERRKKTKCSEEFHSIGIKIAVKNIEIKRLDNLLKAR